MLGTHSPAVHSPKLGSMTEQVVPSGSGSFRHTEAAVPGFWQTSAVHGFPSSHSASPEHTKGATQWQAVPGPPGWVQAPPDAKQTAPQAWPTWQSP